MDYRKEFVVKPGTKVKLGKLDPGYTGKHMSEQDALATLQKHCGDLRKLQSLL